MTVYCCFIFVVVVVFLFAVAVSLFLLQGRSTEKVLLHHMQQAGALEDFLTIIKCFWTTCEACTQQSAWLLERLIFADVGDLTTWHKTTNCYRATIVCLDANGLWKPGQSFILAGFTLSLLCSAPCGTEQTTIDTGCDPALPRNCVDHPADCNLLKNITLLNRNNSAINIKPR